LLKEWNKGDIMKKIVSLCFFVGLFFLMSGQAQAVIIHDTGLGTVDNAYALSDNQWIAGQFSVSQNYIITSVLGGIGSNAGGNLTLALYTDGVAALDPYAGKPVPNSQLYSTNFFVPAIPFGTSPTDPYPWQGVSGLSWSIAPGTYWLAFESRSASSPTSFDFYGGMNTEVPNPLDDYAVWTSNYNRYYNYDGENPNYSDLDAAFKIEGNPAGGSPVPEPATMFLFISGLLGLAGVKKRKA
jgi:PEP-CTERM motif-containing protein